MKKRILKQLSYIGIFLLTIIIIWAIGSIIFVKHNASKYDISIVPIEQIKRLPAKCRYLCFVDFNKPSRENRFFIFDVKQKECLYAGLVEHGRGGSIKDAKCSNVPGSKRSCKGLFKITGRGKMNNPNYPWSCFFLNGLDTTNDKARERNIYIHYSHRATTYFEKTGAYFQRFSSEGCFAISWFAMRYLEYLYDGNMYLYAQYM